MAGLDVPLAKEKPAQEMTNLWRGLLAQMQRRRIQSSRVPDTMLPTTGMVVGPIRDFGTEKLLRRMSFSPPARGERGHSRLALRGSGVIEAVPARPTSTRFAAMQVFGDGDSRGPRCIGGASA
jgi:hypothetical protein